MKFKAPTDNTGVEAGAAAFPSSRIERYPSLLKPLLIVFVAAMLLALLFIVLASEVREGDTRFFDMQLLL